MQGLRPMAQLVFDRCRELTKGLGIAIGNEKWIVAESSRIFEFADDMAFHRPAESRQFPACPGQNNDTPETTGSILGLNAIQAPQ